MSRLSQLTQTYSGNAKAISRKSKTKNSFILSCHYLIVDAYGLLKANYYDVNWDEETFSANMKHELEKVCSFKRLPYHITRENVQDNTAILKGLVKAKTAKKIDIVFATFITAKKLIYGIEAKILVENNFNSKRFSFLNSEYITEGMDRYIKNIYKINGCMVGYVIEGDPDIIISKINTLLDKNSRVKEIIGSKFSLNSFNYCYLSEHSSSKLTHFLLPFQKK